jgi:glycerol-3-phosphate dehydrogenase
LEHFEFALVRKALAEREVLLKSAPHIIRPLRFVMPHDPGMRPVWMVRAGLFLYDHLARREVLPSSRTITLAEHPAGAALKSSLQRAFVYSDAWVDDARLVVLNAMHAAALGATVLTRCACVDAQRQPGYWQLRLNSADSGLHTVRARALVNAAGPWAAQFLADVAHAPQVKSLRLIKGSHIVVRRLFEHDHAYIFQNPDKRIIFAIPYEGDFTLIGTTEVEQHGELGSARVEAAEIDYLCEQANRYFRQQLRSADVLWHYCGVRPLLDDETGDASAVTRDYALELDTTAAPLLSVWGGKITTFRKLAEEAADRLAPMLGARRGAWTQTAFLPGGDLSGWIGEPQRPDTDFLRFEQALALRHPELPPPLCQRLARGYGACVEQLLGAGPLGDEVAPGLFEAELRYLRDHEWACSADDVLWRRTKLGLHYSAEQRAAVADWCLQHVLDAAPAEPERAWN